MATNEKDLTNIFASDFVKNTKEDLCHIAASYMRVCFRLLEANRCKYYEALGYPDIYSCAETELDLSRSTVIRMMQICKRFSAKNGNHETMFIDKKFQEFNFSQLCELVTMNDKDIKLIKPDMSVKAIRYIKNNIRNKFSNTIELSKNLIENKKNSDDKCSTGATSHQMKHEVENGNIIIREEKEEPFESNQDDEVRPEVRDIKECKGLTKKDITDVIEDIENDDLFERWLWFDGVDQWYKRFDAGRKIYVIMYQKDNSYSDILPFCFYIFYADHKYFDFDAAYIDRKDFINDLFWELQSEG